MASPNRLLLDTHVFLWWRTDSPRVRDEARTAIGMADLVFVSAASAWEAAIKIGLGRLEIPESFEAGVVDSGFEKLLIRFSHAERTARLPHHHRDPFDRLLIAQAQEEDLVLVTHDRAFKDYQVEVLWT
jgi:PIN domain nuclease of toxin-antitoxin system